MATFKTTVDYGGRKIIIETDDFRELHQAVARIEELSADAAYLATRLQSTGDTVGFRYFIDSGGNEYFGFQGKKTHCNVTFGQYREKQVVPFFPKGEEGYYDGSSSKPTKKEAPTDDVYLYQ